ARVAAARAHAAGALREAAVRPVDGALVALAGWPREADAARLLAALTDDLWGALQAA
ncbi:MAG: hypothetical protein HY909_17765, partial [Deltaproteobacteria bacterium]|nr:hypothetical protein [Deltaproteobacteria bacterium]